MNIGQRIRGLEDRFGTSPTTPDDRPGMNIATTNSRGIVVHESAPGAKVTIVTPCNGRKPICHCGEHKPN